MTKIVSFKPAARRVPASKHRRSVLDMFRPKPWSKGRVFGARQSLLLSMVFAVAVVTGTGLQDHGTKTNAPNAAKPRSLIGGNAWNNAPPSFAGSLPGAITGRVSYVRDGDTFIVGSTPVRIANLDCPEAGTMLGDKATRRARDLVQGRTVTCRHNSQTSYDRLIGICSLADGRDFGRVMAAQIGCSLH
ncbi:thermonuclease family protein [Roseovarius nanhaiticus]|uniref:thermonuclease family protein n=1 Tax=Roseovarius nanhaiticus TaxID=573024 RepID=UPI0011141D12|nr:hypothetical protein [Roseovarius nanhaiticus]